MIGKHLRRAALAAALLALAWGTAQAQSRYGSRSGGYGASEGQGFLLFVEAGLFNPRNTDNVVATEILDSSTQGSRFERIIPVWDDELAGRIGVGWSWASGNRLLFSYWDFSADVRDTGSTALGAGSVLAFPIGPPVATGGGGFVGDTGAPGFYDITTEIESQTADVAWAHRHEMTDSFSLQWSAGLRYANFEETHAGSYDEAGSAVGVNRFAVAKRNEGEMIGARLAVRGQFRTGPWRLASGIGFSFLDGEVRARSSLVPDGSSNGGLPPSLARLTDDSRSGSIRDFDVEAGWWSSSEGFGITVGWEQQRWEEIATDLVRNFPATVAPLTERDAVVFSGARLGLHLRF